MPHMARRGRRMRKRDRPHVSKAVKSFVRSALRSNLETKFLLHTGASVPFNATTPLGLDMINVSQDVSQNGRIGNQIRITGVTIRLQIVSNQNSFMRFLLVWSNENENAATFALTPAAALDLDTVSIVHEVFPIMRPQYSGDLTVFVWTKHIRFNNSRIIYDSSSISSRQRRNLVLKCATTTNNLAGVINYETRTFYKDG